jgi:mannose-6-phosphate isomerase-like protein (cupin superfamily)
VAVLITGVDADGRSCVVEAVEPDPESFVDGITVGFAAATPSAPPPMRPPGRGSSVGVQASTPGLVRWSFIEFGPGASTAMHHTDSVDFDVVLDGEVDIVLDDGAHRLRAGDGVVINGVDHGWATQDVPCRMSVVVIATPPRSEDT